MSAQADSLFSLGPIVAAKTTIKITLRYSLNTGYIPTIHP
jgi:hypothetical protein